jgi:hypothetical protein
MSYFTEYVDFLFEDDVNCAFIDEKDIHNYNLSQMDERIIKQRVVRGGKRKFRFQTDKAGFKVVIDKQGVPKEFLIPPKEKLARELSQKKAARLRKVKQDPAQAKRASSLKRTGMVKKSSRELKQDELLKKKRDKEKEEKEREQRLKGSSFSEEYYGI